MINDHCIISALITTYIAIGRPNQFSATKSKSASGKNADSRPYSQSKKKKSGMSIWQRRKSGSSHPSSRWRSSSNLSFVCCFTSKIKPVIQEVLAVHDFVVHEFAFHELSKRSRSLHFTCQTCNSRIFL